MLFLNAISLRIHAILNVILKCIYYVSRFYQYLPISYEKISVKFLKTISYYYHHILVSLNSFNCSMVE